MADIENEKRRRKKSSKEADAAASDSSPESGEQFVQANLKDLVSSAMGALDDLAASAAPATDSGSDADATPHAAPASDASSAAAATSVDEAVDSLIPETVESDATENMSAAEVSEATEAAADSVEWNAETADLAFEDADGSESEQALDANAAIVAEMSGAAETAAPNAGAQAGGDSEAGAAMSLDSGAGVTEPAAAELGATAEPAPAKKKSVAEQLADVSGRSERLQELARMVAKTVGERKAELDGDNMEAAEGEGVIGEEPLEPEQMGFEALEEELDAADNDADPEPTEFVEADQLISIVESLLFSTDKPVSLATIKSLFKGTNVRTKDIARALDTLASEYASSQRGVTLEEINGGYQLRTKVDNAEFLKRLQKVRPFRLSGPALETMAIVAYKQPVTKYEIDEIRGVESGHLLRALMERGMVQFAGKAEDKPGKPMAYGSTRKFLETFGLRNLKELPTLSEIDELLPEGIGETEEKEKLSDITEELSNDFQGGYSDNEEELLKINDTLQAIDTTSEFFEQEKIREREKRDRERAQDLRERLVLGEQIDPKDQKWLDRYEAKLHADANAPVDGTPTSIPADEIEAAEPISGQLETLTAESAPAETSDDDAEELADLDANLDWDDDAEAESEDTSNDV